MASNAKRLHKRDWRVFLLIPVIFLCIPATTKAQGSVIENQHLQIGIGIFTGIGLQAGYINPRSFYTVEGILYVDVSPQFAGGEGSFQVSGGLGGSLRVFGIMRSIGSQGYSRTDLDIGLRFGPSLYFAFGESSRDENPFALCLEPFVRFTSTSGNNRMFFLEGGFNRPFLRGGFLFAL